MSLWKGASLPGPPLSLAAPRLRSGTHPNGAPASARMPLRTQKDSAGCSGRSSRCASDQMAPSRPLVVEVLCLDDSALRGEVAMRDADAYRLLRHTSSPDPLPGMVEMVKRRFPDLPDPEAADHL